MNTNLLKEIIKSLKYRFNLDDDKAGEEEVVENIRKGVEFRGINLWTLIFAIIIASIGLNVNSTAVIIGAMLISPIMGPIMGLGLGAGIFDIDLIKKAAKNLLLATVIGLLTSTFYFFISPLDTAQSELLARTTPTIWDVLIAFFGGLAGIVASSRKKYNNVIPGVAIATALMPPLCTAGFGIATGQWSYFFGAFYLYLINSVFISIATFLIVRFLKYKPASFLNSNTAIVIRRWIGIIAICMILPSLYLAFRFVTNEIFSQNANKFITEEVLNRDFSLLKQNIDIGKRSVSITLIGDNNIDSLKSILEIKKSNYDLEDAVIILKNNSVGGNSNKALAQLKEGIIEDLFVKQEELIKQKSDEIEKLKQQNENEAQFVLKKEEAINEFCALYGTPQELIIERTILHDEFDVNDTVLIVYVNSKNSSITANLNQIDSWLQTKFKVSKTKILIK